MDGGGQKSWHCKKCSHNPAFSSLVSRLWSLVSPQERTHDWRSSLVSDLQFPITSIAMSIVSRTIDERAMNDENPLMEVDYFLSNQS